MKKTISLLLVAVMLISVLTTSASASTSTGSYVQITIEACSYSSAFTAYNSAKEADKYPITIQVAEDEFPVKAEIKGKNGGHKSYTFDTYGTKTLKVSDINEAAHMIGFLFTFGMSMASVLIDDTARYATVNIVKPELVKSVEPAASAGTNSNAGTSSSTRPSINTKPGVAVHPDASINNTGTAAAKPTALTLDQKAEKLIDALGLPFAYYSVNTCVYTTEIRDYIAGEWDGRDRTGDDYGGYNAARYVMSREYYWIASNLLNGKSYSLSANVDYDGYKEVIPARSSNQSYSLAVSRSTGEIEKWSFFEQQDAWVIDQVANGDEEIKSIIPLASNSSGKDDCQVFVSTTDASGVQHMYSLMPNGEVIRTV